MLLSQIRLLLENKVSIDSFKRQIQSEVSSYKKQLSKKGASAPIYLTEDIFYTLAEQGISTLKRVYQAGQLDQFEISYLADTLLLAEKVKFSNEDIEDDLESFSLSGS